MLFSAIVQSKPNATTGPTDTTVGTNGTSLAANYTNATGTTTYNLIQPGTTYGPRVNTVDLRAAKVLNFGRYKTTIGADLYNLFNSNTGLTFNQNYGTGSNYLRAHDDPHAAVPANQCHGELLSAITQRLEARG